MSGKDISGLYLQGLCDLEIAPISDFSSFPTLFHARSRLATTLPYFVEHVIHSVALGLCSRCSLSSEHSLPSVDMD